MFRQFFAATPPHISRGEGSASGADRRDSDRFPIEQEVRYRALGKRGPQTEGTGKTLNISSHGVLFTANDKALTLGRRIELSIVWPAQLNNDCRLKLVVCGRICRIEPSLIAVEIGRYEFRTLGKGLRVRLPEVLPCAREGTQAG